MSKTLNTIVGNKDEWLTPPYITEALGEFDLDPCQPVKPPFTHAKNGYNLLNNGLFQKWEGRVWLNPPYGKYTFHWIRALADHGNGIALIFARTETNGFYQNVWKRADAVFFFRGRIKFFHVSGEEARSDGGAPSCLIAYGQNNVNSIREAVEKKLIKGKLVVIDN